MWAGEAAPPAPAAHADRTQACLLLRAEPPRADDACSPAWRHVGCLRAHVPAWGASYERVSACFRCCLLDAVSSARLQRNYRFWTPLLDAFHARDRTATRSGMHVETSVLYTAHSLMQYADLGALYRDLRCSNGTSGVLRHVDAGGRRGAHLPMSLFAPAPLDLLHAGAPLLVAAHDGYTRALGRALRDLQRAAPFCMRMLSVEDRPPFAVDPADGRTLVVAGDDDAAGNATCVPAQIAPRRHGGGPARPRSCPAGADGSIVEWFTSTPPPGASATSLRSAFIPVETVPRGLAGGGWVDALSGHALQTERRRPRLVLCGCMNIWSGINRRRGPKLDALARNGVACNRAMRCGDYKRDLLTSKFVVSPAGNGPQNFRDWEALVAGAIPLLDYEPRFARLWAGLPVVHVADWSAVTPAALERLWADMQAPSLPSPATGPRDRAPPSARITARAPRAQSRDYSLSKAYWPHWLDVIVAPTRRRDARHADAAAPSVGVASSGARGRASAAKLRRLAVASGSEALGLAEVAGRSRCKIWWPRRYARCDGFDGFTDRVRAGYFP